MFARVTLLEIDTMRASVADVLERFRGETLERLRIQPGYQGVWVLATPEGKGLVMSLWDTQAQADIEGDHQFYGKELGHFAALFRAAPGREEYEVLYVDEPTANWG
jgi:hypothetical protein